MFPKELTELTNKLISSCRNQDIKIATAESCTGGLIAGCLTSISGSSDVFERGFNTYSNNAKVEMLDVPIDMIIARGAVSETVAIAMCEGALKNAPVQLTVSVTGIAGPAGGTHEKPIGTVYIASARDGRDTVSKCYTFDGNRDKIRVSTIKKAIEIMLSQV
ncbi:MAG TPA: CinA family protein [Rhodospirillales bacterium]|jgi:nicotinamide-nucleotide amidase|nr:CinA family protein [Rhodospirillales bacterium]HIL76331.1 CinA family protein [Rhodospirillales bacterium]